VLKEKVVTFLGNLLKIFVLEKLFNKVVGFEKEFL
jgi:hypothetical protein